MSEKKHKYLLIFSNLAYLFPVGVVLYQLLKRHGRRMDLYIGIELILVLLFITFFTSSSYHACRSDLSLSTNDPSQEKMQIQFDPCLPCTKENNVPFNLSKTFDYFFANFISVLVLINVIPLKQNFRQLYIIISVIWFSFFLLSANYIAAAVPSMVALAIFFTFWILMKSHFSALRNGLWISAQILMVLAYVFFTLEPYWLFHSFWHICGALAVGLLLMQSCGCFENINGQPIIPSLLQPIFKPTNFCRKYDL